VNVRVFTNLHGKPKFENGSEDLAKKYDNALYNNSYRVSFLLSEEKETARRSAEALFPFNETGHGPGVDNPFIRDALARNLIDPHEADLVDDLAPLPPDATAGEIMAAATQSVARVLAHRRAHPRPQRRGPPPKLPPLCRPDKLKLAYDEIGKDDSDPQRVRQVFDGYAEAVEAVYGQRVFAWWRHSKKRIEDVKGYDRLLKAAEALVEKGIAPAAWAHWRLSYAKAHGAARKPWFVTQVFAAGTILKRSGWFRKEYDGPQGVQYKWTQEHLEQLFRHQEAILRWENKRRNPLIGFPKWYAAMRRQETEKGFKDPLACWSKV